MWGAAAVIVAAICEAEYAKSKSDTNKYTKVKNKEFFCKNCGAPEIGAECQYCKTIFHREGR